MKSRHTVRAIAAFEAAKGALALLATSGLLVFFHADLHALAQALGTHLHLNPANHLQHLLTRLDADVGTLDPRWLIAAACAYAVFRFVEAYGLWYERTWAEWLAAFSGAIYVPFEIAELVRHPDAFSAAALLINLLVVAFMLYLLWARRAHAGRPPSDCTSR